MIDPNIYNNIGGGSEVLQYIYPKFYSFIVTDLDYQTGFVDRYFVQKVNDKNVIEVAPKSYNEIENKLFVKVSVRWILIGPERNVYINGKLYEQGVYEKNLQEINNAAKVMPSIKKYVTNYTQYRKG